MCEIPYGGTNLYQHWAKFVYMSHLIIIYTAETRIKTSFNRTKNSKKLRQK